MSEDIFCTMFVRNFPQADKLTLVFGAKPATVAGCKTAPTPRM